MLVYFMTIWNILPVAIWYNSWPFGIVCGLLLYFSQFGMLGPRKIWQPCTRSRLLVIPTYLTRASQNFFSEIEKKRIGEEMVHFHALIKLIPPASLRIHFGKTN
jgi:hypothetical protein